MNWPISSTLVNNSISTKRKETFPLLSSLILFLGKVFVVGHLTTAGVNGKLMLICFWQQSYPVSLRYWQHVPFGKPPFPQSIPLSKRGHYHYHYGVSFPTLFYPLLPASFHGGEFYFVQRYRAFSMVCHFPLFLMMLLIKHSDGASFTTELSGDAPFLLYCTIFHTASPPIYYIVYSDIVVVHGRPVKRRRCLSIMI